MEQSNNVSFATTTKTGKNITLLAPAGTDIMELLGAIVTISKELYDLYEDLVSKSASSSTGSIPAQTSSQPANNITTNNSTDTNI